MSSVAPFEPKIVNSPNTRRGHIVISHLSVVFANSQVAVHDVSIDIKPGEFVCLLGPSGCGKSTVLNSVAGYIQPTSGVIRLDRESVRGPGPERGMVFQQYSLFPWKTARQNVEFGPLMAGKAPAERKTISDRLLDLVGLTTHADRYPAMLSGGMQQRIGIARALANAPSVLLMDEPFGALDAQTRMLMQETLLSVWKETGTTVLFVTHDVDEAIFLADRVLVMSASPGRIVEDIAVGLPRPRDMETFASTRFAALKRQCLYLIRQESLRAFHTQSPN